MADKITVLEEIIVHVGTALYQKWYKDGVKTAYKVTDKRSGDVQEYHTDSDDPVMWNNLIGLMFGLTA